MARDLAHPSLSGDALISTLRQHAGRIKDLRRNPDIPLEDVFMSCFAIFSIKLPSLLAAENLESRVFENVKQVYRINAFPSDTRMREVLDEVDPSQIATAFSELFRVVQRSKKLEDFVFHDGAYLLSMDGTGYFSSNKVKCEHCLVT
jgi:hypothetical protein